MIFQVPVDSLIDQYLNAYSHGDLRASSPVVIKPFQSETESSERSLSPRILSPKVRHEASPQVGAVELSCRFINVPVK